MLGFFLIFYVLPSTVVFAAGVFLGLWARGPISLTVAAAAFSYAAYAVWPDLNPKTTLAEIAFIHLGAMASMAAGLGLCVATLVLRSRALDRESTPAGGGPLPSRFEEAIRGVLAGGQAPLTTEAVADRLRADGWPEERLSDLDAALSRVGVRVMSERGPSWTVVS